MQKIAALMTFCASLRCEYSFDTLSPRSPEGLEPNGTNRAARGGYIFLQNFSNASQPNNPRCQRLNFSGEHAAPKNVDLLALLF